MITNVSNVKREASKDKTNFKTDLDRVKRVVEHGNGKEEGDGQDLAKAEPSAV